MSTIAIGAVLAMVGLVAPTVRAHRQNRLARANVRRCDRTVATFTTRRAGAGPILARIVSRIDRRRRSIAQPAQILAAMLDDTARRCASGHSMTAAFECAAAGLSDDVFSLTRAELGAGATIDEALAHEQPGHPDLALAIHVLRLCARQGGNVSESLDRAAATLRERHAASQERVAQAAQARLSAKVLTVVPIAFATWTMLTTASVQRFMITPVGLVCAATGIGLNLIGWSLMNRSIRGLL